MNRKRYIGVLSDQDQQALQAVVESSVSHRQRQRAQAILCMHPPRTIFFGK